MIRALCNIGVIFAVMFFVSFPVVAGDFDFRKTRWGMSLEEVKKSEDSEPTLHNEEVGGIVYTAKVANLDVFVFYYFVDDKLYKANYYINEKYVNKNNHIIDFNKLKDILDRRYGQPKEDRVIWTNNLYKTDPQKAGFAISIGHLAKYAKWFTDSTEITLAIRGENYKISLIIEYLSPVFAELQREKNRKKQLEVF